MPSGHFREDKELAEKIIRWTIAFVTAVKCTLRREQVNRPICLHQCCGVRQGGWIFVVSQIRQDAGWVSE